MIHRGIVAAVAVDRRAQKAEVRNFDRWRHARGFISSCLTVAFFLLPIACFAAGGTCPSGSTYGISGNQALAALGVTSCFFVAASGSDSNNGTSESTPWQHAPGMPSCSNTCLTVWNATLPAGTGIILRGGDTWHMGNSSASPYTGGEWNFNASPYPEGSSSSPIYVGVDQTWYTGASWARPILTGDNPLCSSSTVGGSCHTNTLSGGIVQYYVSSCTYSISGGANNILELGGLKYYTIDNFEMLGVCAQNVGQPNHKDSFISYGSISGPMIFSNLYIHGWSHLQYAASNGSAGCTGSVMCVDTFSFYGGNLETITNDVIDGSDSDPVGLGFCFGGGHTVEYSVIRYTSQCVTSNAAIFHDNLVEYFFENGHSNVFESGNTADASGTDVLYNNVFRHLETSGGSGGVALWLSPPTGATWYIFNNLLYDEGSMELINIGTNGVNQGNEVYFNNTFQTTVNQNIMNCQYLAGGLTDTNNYFIDDGSVYSSPCNNKTTTTDVTMTNATATADGYTASQTYAYSPTTGSSPTLGVGTNENTAYCGALASAGLNDAATACQSDTTYACTYNSANHTVSCPTRSTVSRGSSWAVGAYSSASTGTGTGTGPQPSTSLTATAR